jgi:CheY-like chemotaxis protein
MTNEIAFKVRVGQLQSHGSVSAEFPLHEELQMEHAQTQTRVFLVEDDDQDAFPFKKMLREEAEATQIDRAIEGQKALELLQSYEEAELPHCIVMDLRLAGEDGLWLLDRLLENEALARIPVIVFSGDVDRLQRAASSFANVISSVRKPETLEQYRTALTIVTAIMRASVGDQDETA